MDTMNTPRPTPETNLFMDSLHGSRASWEQFAQKVEDFARKLERERDEAREWQNVKVTKNGETHCLGTLIDLLERERDEAREDTPWHSNGETKDEWFARQREKYAVIERERDEARDQLKAMREAIKEVSLQLTFAENVSCASVLHIYVYAALAKLKPFIP